MLKTPRLAAKLLRLLDMFELLMLYLLSAALLGLTIGQIVLRNFFNISLYWSDDCVRIMVLWLMMAGAMVASRTNRHIQIDLFASWISPSLLTPLKRIVYGLTALICGLVAYYSITFIVSEYKVATTVFLNVPTWVCALIMPVGFSIMAFRYCVLVRHPGRATSEFAAS